MNKTLFIFSDDFGELVLLRLLIYKQPFHVHLVLPERLYEHVQFSNATKYLFKNSDDIYKYIEEVQPSQVCLFSAYLLAPNGLLSFAEFHELLAYLDEKQITVATSDPFMRFYDELAYEHDTTDFRTNVKNTLKKISERVSNYRHLYGVPVQFEGAPHQSFSNPHKRPMPAKIGDKMQWTFVLAYQDYMLLQTGYEFKFHLAIEPILASLVATPTNHVNLIFPKELMKLLQPMLQDSKNITFVEYCNLVSFEEIIMKSTVLMYWNIFSASTLLCRLYNKPTVFLGQGHMETIFLGFYNYIKASWFPYQEPKIISLNDDFITTVMTELKAADESENHPFYQPYFELASPIEIINAEKSFS